MASLPFRGQQPEISPESAQMNFGLVVHQPGQDFPAHYHEIMEENFFVLEGELEIHIDGEIFSCREGDFIHVEPKKVHYLVNKGKDVFKGAFMLAPYQIKDKVDVDYRP
nr:cupin domain-containing protein [Bacillus sp. MMSF_3328]